MKHLKLFFALFAMLALGVGNAWGADPSVGDVIFQEEFTVTAKTMANAYDFAGTTTWSGSTSGLSYVSSSTSSYMETQTANPITSANFFFVKASESNLTMSGISIPSNTTAITVSFQSNKTIVKCTYSFDGTNFSTGATSKSGVQTFDIDCTGKSRLYFKFSKTGTSSNARIDNVIVKVKSVTSGSGSTESDVSVTDEQLKWSATTATALKGADNNEFPTLTNALGLTVTYDSSNKDAATIAADGKITLLAPGITTISAIFAGGEVSGTKYAAKTVTYTLTVKQLVSCADIYNLADDATFVLKDFVVTYVNGKYTYIKDDTGYGLIYKDSYGLIAGDQVASGKFEGKRDSYNGLVEIIPTTAAVDLHATNGTAPEPALMTTNPIAGDMNKYVKFENVSFASTAFSSKSINGTIEGKGSSIKFYDQFATNKTFDTSKKYDVIGVVSMFNSVQVNFISAEEVVEPTLNISKSSLDFGKVKNGSTNEQTFTIKGSQLTKDVTLTVEGEHFTVSPETLTPTEGSLNETITVTYNPTAEDDHTATLKVTSNELTEQTVSLQGSAVAEYTVRFYVNKTEETELAKQVLSGDKLDAMPAEPTSCDQLEYPTFIGWSTSEITGTTTEEPTNLLDLNTVITSDCNYYAVFAKSTTTSGGAGSVTMAYNGGTTTNMTEGNNAATVGLDENEWAVIPAKGDANNLPGLNKDNDIRVYGVETGASNTLTITSANQIITDVTITYTSKSYNTGTVSVNGNNVTPSSSSETEATYAINASSFVIGNSTKTQLRIKSVVINYATSTTTYTYLTTCESVTPTYAVTYNLDGGSSTCETSVVVEKDGELTLCDAPTKTGHTFLNWKDQSDDEYEAGATITVSSDLTLTAQWEKESYKVTWMSLGTEVASANVEYNSQPTKPAEDPTYTCLLGAKEFVGWTTQEIDGVGVPANLYTDEFPVVTEAITYYAVFAGRSAEASTTISTLLVTEKLGNYASGSMKDDQENVWKYYAGGLQDGETYYIALRNNNDEISYIESPKFSGTVQSIVAHVKNGSSKVRTVYLRSSAIEKPAEGDFGATSIPASNNSEVNLDFTSSFDKFYIQVSDGLQFHKIVVTSGIAIGDYVDYVTSCKAFEVSIEVVDQLVFDPINMNTKEEKNLAITTLNYNGALTFSITGTDASHFTYGTFTDGQLPITYQPTEAGEHTATLTITAGEKTATVTLIGKSIDYVSGIWELVTDAATLTIGDKVVVVAKEKNFALSTTQKENNRGQAAVTKNNDNTISFKGDVQILTLKKGFVNNTFALYTSDGYLYAASNSSNHLKTLATIVPKSSWSITIQNDITTIAAQENSHNIMQYNFSSKLFACYENSNLQDPICLYRKKNIKVDETSDNTSIPNQSDVTVDNAELTVTTEAEYDNMYIGGNGTVKVATEVTVNNLYISTTMGATTSGQLNTAPENLIVTGDVFIDITLGKNSEDKIGDPNQWHAFTVPFPVDAMNGVYDINDKKLTNEVNYAIMDYHGDLRANGQYGWKKYRGILVPGTFYLMTVDGARPTYRFKKVEDAAIVAPATKAITAFTGSGDATKDKGWNGVGNPTLMHGKVAYNALVLNPATYTYEAYEAEEVAFTVGTPFFIQAAEDGSMTMTSEPSASLAPARRAAAAVENIKVMLGNSDYTDRLYVSASEDATTEYEIGKDLGKMAMTSMPSVVQISALAYDTRLCMIDAPMANNEALVSLNLYAPANGEYTLSIEAQDNEKVYLLHEGTFVWDLSMSEYPITLNKGDNAGYSILVHRADAPTSVETIDGTNNQTEKLIHNGNLYILHNGKVFDAVGTMLK